MKYFQKSATMFFFVILLFFPFSLLLSTQVHSSSSKAEITHTPKVIKVGMPNSSYFSQLQDDGSYAGIVIDYLQEISKYAGWTLEYVEGTSDELITKLETGEVDILGGMLKNEYTLSKFDFSDYSSGYSYTTLVALKDKSKYVPMDYSSFHGMRVGIIRNSLGRIHAFDTFIENNNLNIIPVYYDDTLSLVNSLKKGEVDAILSNDTSLTENDMIIARFGAIPYYFAVTKGNSSILQDLNTAQTTILEVNPNFDDMVYEKHFNNIGEKPIFNNKEKLFIQNSTPLKVAIVSTLHPLEYYNQSTGGAGGISPDILRLISSRTGLNFEFISVDTLEIAKQQLLKGDVDLITSLDSNSSENGMGIVFTKQYLNTQKVIVKNSSPKKKGKDAIAVLDGYSQFNNIQNRKIDTYDTASACIQAVILGNAEYTSINSLVADYHIYLRRNDHISLTPATNISDGLRFGLAQPANPNLLSILDKAIYSISTEEIQNIVFENTTIENVNINFITLLYTYPMSFALISFSILAILLIAFVLLVLYTRTKLRLSQQLALRGDSYRIISELTNEYIVTFDFDAGILTLPDTFASQTGHNITYTIQQIYSENNEVLKALYSTFANQDYKSKISIEFMCPLINREPAWFKAVGTVITDSDKKPIRGIGRITSIQNEKKEKQILETRANTDALTMLYNRQYSEHKISKYFEQHTDSNQGALMLIDLDYFKKINDTLGHMAGDKVLKEFAQTLNEEFYDDGIIGRWGGDEFIIFIRNTSDENEICNRANDLCKIMNREFHYEGKIHMLSISIGIALANKASSYSELFQNADSALYEAKNAHRNGFKIY